MDGTRLTGLWKNKTRDGKTYLSGKVGLARLLVLPNDFKKADKDPDYYAYVVPSEKKNGGPSPAPKDALEEAGL